MATDETPPRHALILGIAFASVVTLATLKFIFDSYYQHVMEAEVAAKALPPVELQAARLADQQRLAAGPMPIDRAMQDLAKARGTLITPEQSADEGPLVGWSKLPRTPGAPAQSAVAGGDAGAAPFAADAGFTHITPATADGGVLHTGGGGGLSDGGPLTIRSPEPARDGGGARAPAPAPGPAPGKQ
jgi:hypothetical protein